MNDTTTTREFTGERDPIEAHADRFFAEIGREALGKESKQMTKTTGVFVPLKWAERWDFTTAAYLSHFVHYLGTQKSDDGYIWDSEQEVYKKTRITPNQQRRCRRILDADHAIHMKKRGIGNKWNIRPNLPLLILFDDMPSWDEAVGKVVAEMGHDAQPERVEEPEKVGVGAGPLRGNANSEAEVNSVENHEPLREYHEPFRDFRKTHNSNSTETPKTRRYAAGRRPHVAKATGVAAPGRGRGRGVVSVGHVAARSRYDLYLRAVGEHAAHRAGGRGHHVGGRRRYGYPALTRVYRYQP